jgi:3-dehydroquinate synthase
VWLHGEAVAAGICMAADLSVRLGWLMPGQAARITALLRRARLPVQAPAELTSDDFLELMAVDKKARGGRLRLVLLKALGEGVLVDNVDVSLLRSTLDECLSMGLRPWPK